jgi:hypothetical protein
VVVLDYDFPRREPGRTMVIAMVRLYETAYLAGFARDGLGPVLVAAGLESVDVCRLVPGFCASHVTRQRAR